jgi:hypothetical protein
MRPRPNTRDVEPSKGEEKNFCQKTNANAFSTVSGKGDEAHLHRIPDSSLGTGTYPQGTEVVTAQNPGGVHCKVFT